MLVADWTDLSEQWVEGRSDLRWRSKVATSPDAGAQASGSSLLEVEPKCALPRHSDSAEETIIVLQGRAHVTVAQSEARVEAGGVLLVPVNIPHQVANESEAVLRFAALYAAPSVITRYEDEVQPAGHRESKTI